MKRYIATAIILFAGIVLAWSPWSSTAGELGASEAAEDASQGRFAFRFGGGLTEGGSFLGTPGCLVPPENDVRVTDAVFTNDQEYNKFKRGIEFATGYNQFLIEHYPKQSAAICRHS